MTYDPTFSNRPEDVGRFKTVYVDSLQSFPASVSDVITLLDNVTYILTEPINFGTNQLSVPSGGTADIRSVNPRINTLQTDLTGGTPFIIGDMGRLEMRNIVVSSTTGTANCFNLVIGSGVAPVLFMDQCVVQGFASVGDTDGVIVQATNTGLLLNGGGLTIKDSIFVKIVDLSTSAHTGDVIIFDTSVGTAFIDTVAATPASGDSVLNIPSGLTISNRIQAKDCIFSSAAGGTFFDSAGKDQTDPQVYTFENSLVPNSGQLTEVSTTYAANQFDENIIADVSGGGFTVTLPSAVGLKGNKISVKKKAGSAAVLVINTTDGQTINGSASINLLGSKGPALTFLSDNSNWGVV